MPNDDDWIRLRNLLVNELGISDVRQESRLQQDLGADSLDVIEVTMAVEEEFDIEITDEEASGWRQARDVLRTVREHA